MKIIEVKEYDEVEIPQDIFSREGEITAYAAVLQRDYFSVRFRKGKAVFQAGGYVGTIPINSNLSLNISPKVPIKNLERIVFLANHSPDILKYFKRSYGYYEHSSSSIFDVLIDCFIFSVEEVVINGLLKLYDEKRSVGVFPKGKIDFKDTVRVRSKCNDSRVSSVWSERNTNNPANQLIKTLLVSLIENKNFISDKKKRLLVWELLGHFEGVEVGEIRSLVQNDLIKQSEDKIPHNKHYYLSSISLAKMIISGHGFSFLNNSPVETSSLILNLDIAFEAYVLCILDHKYICGSGFRVLDGNKGGEHGGKKRLFDPSNREAYIGKEVKATPDILIEGNPYLQAGNDIVIDVKYKSIKNIAPRPDLNQIISYAVSYGSKYGLLVVPAISDKKSGLLSLGIISGIEFFQYAINLGAPDIEKEEKEFRRIILELLVE